MELNFEKDYHKKCEYSIKELTDNRDKICKENEQYSKEIEREKETIKELSFEVEKNKTMKKEIEVLNLQMERI